MGEPLHEDGDEEDGGGEGGQLDLLQNGGEKGEVSQAELRCAVPGQGNLG